MIKRLRNFLFLLTCVSGLSYGQSGASLSAAQFIDSVSASACGLSGTIVRSNDGGITWFTQSSGVSTYLFGMGFANSNVGNAVGGDPTLGTEVILRTTNGGATWSPQPGGSSQPLLGVSFSDVNNGFAVGYTGTILHTTNGGSTWQAQNTGISTAFDDVSAIDANTATIVGDLGVIIRTTNAGTNWTVQTSGTSSDLYGVRFVNANTGTAVGLSGMILRTTNGGSTWTKQTSGTTNNLNSVCFVDVNNGWTAGNNGVILHTTNGGTNWTNQSVPIANFAGISFKDASTGIVVGDHGTTILRTTNGGSSWTQQSVSAATVPAAPALSSPANSSTGQPTTLTLSWNASTGATTYRLQLSTSSAFTTTVLDDSTITATSRQVSGLANNTTYYWRVNAKNSGGTSSWSAAWSFTTIVATPGAFNLVSPGNGVSGQAVSGSLSWQSSTNATGYDVYLDGNNPPVTVVSTNQAGTSYNYAALANGSSYYWKVVAKNAGGSATASGAPWSFATIVAAPATPALAAPANGATNQPTTLALSWNASSGATSYRLQVSASAAFTTNVFDDSTISTTSRQVTGLANNSTYYWRVNASNPGGTSLYSSAWSFTTVVASPGAFSLVSPSNAASNQAVSGTLSWQSSANATGYDVYLDGSNPPVTVVSTNQAGTSYNYAALANGSTYYWKVVAKNAGGSTTATGAPWSFATIVAAPATPVLAAPANGASNQPTTLTLSWNASTGASSYRVQVSTSSTFATTIVDDSTVSGTTRQVSGLANSSTYYWRVSTLNAGGTSAFSSGWSFTTIVASPGAFNLVSPSNAASNQAVSGTLSWQSSANATGYDVYLDGSNPPATIVSTNQAGTSYNFAALANGSTYYWKVVAKNAGGSTTATGAPWSFATIVAAPATPVLASPANGASNQPITLALSWNASTGASSYRVQVSTSSTFATTIVDDSTISSTSRQVSGLANSTAYYWRVNAKNSGGTSAWSAVWSLTTIVASPGAFNLVSPSNAASNQAVSGILSWQSSANATGYDVYLDGSNPPATVVSTNQAGTSYNYAALTNGSTYYWKVVAKNAGGSTTATGAPWSFATIVAAPAMPVLAAPANGSSNQPTTVILSWNASAGASSYRLQVSTSSAFASFLIDDSTVSVTSRQVTGLGNNTTYYWRVNAKNSGGTSAWSAVWSLTTIVASPGAFNLVSPSNAASNQAVSGILSWQSSANATGYDVYLDGSNPPATVVSTNQAGTSYNYAALANGSTYYWKVVAKNAGGSTTATGAPWSFATIVAPPATPVLASPANGSGNQPTTLTLSWNASAGAASYRVQLSTSSSFATTVLDDSTISATSRQVSGLANNMTYYWRVNAKNSGGTSAWSGSWSLATLPPLPASFSLVSPSNSAAGQSLSGMLSWQSSANATGYDVYLDGNNPPVTVVSSNQAGTSYNYASLVNGSTYYWNVVAKNAAGSTTASSVPWSFTTVVAPPQAPSPASPTDGSTSQPTTLTVSWNASNGANSYRFQLATNSSFAPAMVDDSSLTTTSRQLGGLTNNVMYYWRVSARNAGGSSSYSTTSTFTTVPNLPSTTTLPATSVSMGGATLNGNVNPNGATTTAWFEWDSLSTMGTFQSTNAQSLGTGTSTVSIGSPLSGLAAGTKYYFRTASQNAAGTRRDTTMSFTTTPSAPTLVSPPNGSIKQATTPILSWNLTQGASNYRLQVSSVASFSTTVFDDSTQTSKSAAVGPLAGGMKYYWRTSAINSGGVSTWSAVWNFTTSKNPNARVAVSTKSINFGPVAPSSTKKDSFELYNTGDTSVVVTGITPTDPTFTVSQQGLTLAPGDSQRVYVVASPQSQENLIASILLSYDNNLSPDTIAVQVDSVSALTGVGIEKAPPAFSLAQNYPNPFNPSTVIRFSLPHSALVTLKVYNLLGQEVATLLDRMLLSSGAREVTFDGSRLASGLYFYRLTAEGSSPAPLIGLRRMLLVK